MHDKILTLIEALALNSNNEVLLGKRLGRPRIGAWSMPCHYSQSGKPSKIAHDVLSRETGLIPQKVRFFSCSYHLLRSEQIRLVSKIFLCTDFVDEDMTSTHDNWQWFPWNKLPESIFDSLRSLKERHSELPNLDETPSWFLYPDREQYENDAGIIRFQSREAG